MGTPSLLSMGNGSFCIQVLSLKAVTCTFLHLSHRGLAELTRAHIPGMVTHFYFADEKTLASTLCMICCNCNMCRLSLKNSQHFAIPYHAKLGLSSSQLSSVLKEETIMLTLQ